MLQVYTGDGKGKTTAALGLALRSLGQGKMVCLVQFMKKGDFGEIKALKKFKNITVRQFGRRSFVNPNKPKVKDFQDAIKGMAYVQQILKGKKYQLVILDEINTAIGFKLIKISDFLKILNTSISTEIILTGRGAHAKIMALADLVTEMKAIKHYYRQGVKARKGVEY